VTVPAEGIRLGKPFKLRISPGTFKGEADYSIVLSASSYNSKHEFGVLKKAEGTKFAEIIVTGADWGAPWLKPYVPARTMTFDVLLVAKPKGGSSKEAAFLKHIMIPVLPPRLGMLCGRKQRAFKKDQTIACNVQIWNPLPYPLPNAVMSFTISGQASQSEQAVQKQMQEEQQQAKTIESTPAPEGQCQGQDT